MKFNLIDRIEYLGDDRLGTLGGVGRRRGQLSNLARDDGEPFAMLPRPRADPRKDRSAKTGDTRRKMHG